MREQTKFDVSQVARRENETHVPLASTNRRLNADSINYGVNLSQFNLPSYNSLPFPAGPQVVGPSKLYVQADLKPPPPPYYDSF